MELRKANLTPELAGNIRTQLGRALRSVYKAALAREPLSSALATLLLQVALVELLRGKREQELGASDEPSACPVPRERSVCEPSSPGHELR